MGILRFPDPWNHTLFFTIFNQRGIVEKCCKHCEKLAIFSTTIIQKKNYPDLFLNKKWRSEFRLFKKKKKKEQSSSKNKNTLNPNLPKNVISPFRIWILLSRSLSISHHQRKSSLSRDHSERNNRRRKEPEKGRKRKLHGQQLVNNARVPVV